MLRACLLLSLSCAAAYVLPSCTPVRAPGARGCSPVVMDETIMQKALAGELEEEGYENVFLTEVGWASYLDENAESSYAMNERPSLAEDGYFTPSVFDNPLEGKASDSSQVAPRSHKHKLKGHAVLLSWKDSILSAAGNPLDKAFPTISNDATGARSWGKGADEVKARTIKPKTKDFDPKKRIVGIPGFNAFGAPSSKIESE